MDQHSAARSTGISYITHSVSAAISIDKFTPANACKCQAGEFKNAAGFSLAAFF